MRTFQITFLNVLVKRIAAPNEEALHNFLNRFEIKPEISSLQDYGGALDAIVDDKGKAEFEENIEWWEKQINCLSNPPKNIYEGRRGKKIQVLLNNKKFSPKPSQKIYNHSPDGFEWSYEGSGCAQLALAVLLEETGDPALSVKLHQQFKREVIAKAPEKGWAFASQFVQNWLKEKQCTV